MASSLQRPALRATVALSRFPCRASTATATAGAGASLRASLTTATKATTGRSPAASAPTAPAARPWNRCQYGPTAVWTSRRTYSSDNPPQGKSKIFSFEDVKKIVETPDSPVVLVDTREPQELKETGQIPGAINIPVSSAPDAFFLSDEDFENRFGFHRPDKDTEVVFYCKAGVRSRSSGELARHAGWTKTGEYPGSWLDWERNGGPVQR